MDLTVLGSGAAYPRPGGACSGFLVRHAGTTVWLDAGNGTFSRLQQLTDFRRLDALVLSHAHGDHTADVLPLMYALGFDPQLPVSRIDVYAPREVAGLLTARLGEGSKGMFESVFDMKEAVRPFRIGDLAFNPFRAVHSVEAYGFRIEGGGSTLAYTSDSAWDESLVEPCRGADLLVAEATYVEGLDGPEGMHMWAGQAGRLAAEAGVSRLVLTHIWPTIDPQTAVEEAAAAFDGPVEAAVEGAHYEVA